MKIISCHIENFGKLSDLTVELRDGLNVVCETNGWGKSTLAAFIKAMFYGLAGERKKRAAENERMRYKPWQGGVFGGRLIFEVSGRRYCITRIFGDKEANDEFELRDEATNIVSTDYSERIGEELFGINAESFARTVFIGQSDCMTAANADINARIENPSGDSNDLSNYDSAMKRLAEISNSLTPKRATGSIARRENEIAECARKAGIKASLSESINENEKYLRSEEAHLAKLKEIRQQIIREGLRHEDRTEDDMPERSYVRRRLSLPTMIGMLMTAAGIAAVICTGTMPEFGTVSYKTAAVVLVIVGVVILAAGHRARAVQAHDTLASQLTAVEGEMEASHKTIISYNRNLERLREQYDECEEQAVRLAKLRELQEEERDKYRHVMLAQEMLKSAKESMTSKYSAPLKKSFVRNFRAMTGQNATNIHIDANAEVTFDELGRQREVSSYSEGYKDVAGIALRTALIDAMYQSEKPVIFMDDPFSNLDDDKAYRAMEWLKHLSNKYQVIYLTCSRARCLGIDAASLPNVVKL